MKKTTQIITFTILFAFVGTLRVQAQSDRFEQLLNEVVQELSQQENWKSQTAIPKLEAIVKGAKNLDVVLTAKTLLIFYLSEKVTSVQIKEPLLAQFGMLSQQIIDEAPDSWQAAVAQVLIVSDCDFRGDQKTEIVMAKNALATIDFDRLEKTDNPAWNAMKKGLNDYGIGNEPYVFREMLKVCLVNAFCEGKRLHEAEEVMKEFTSEKCASLIRDRVELERKYHEKRKQKKSSQLQGKQQQTHEPVKTVAPPRNPVVQNPVSKTNEVPASTNNLPAEAPQSAAAEKSARPWKFHFSVLGIGILVGVVFFKFRKK